MLIEREGNGVGSLVRFHLVDATHLAEYTVKDNGTEVVFVFLHANTQLVATHSCLMFPCCR
jgi:hypothetical protein